MRLEQGSDPLFWAPGTLVPKEKVRRTRSWILLVGRNPESSEGSLQGPSSWLSPDVQSPDGLWFQASCEALTPAPGEPAEHPIPGLRQWSLTDLRAQMPVTHVILELRG